MPTIKAKQGYTNCFFQKITVSNGAFTANTNPDVFVNVSGLNNFSLSNETGSSVVEVSFNGNSVQDELDSTQVTKMVTYTNRPVGAIWFRLKSGATATVSIRAW